MKRSFTLVELLVVIVIVGIILAMVVPITMRMVADAENTAAHTQISGMLRVARVRAIGEMTCYGVCFYVDYLTGKQRAAFIRWGGIPPDSHQTGPYWCRYADRMVVVPGKIYLFSPAIRVRPLQPPYWNNTFVIVFNPKGMRETIPRNYRYIIHDPDNEPLDNCGDILGMPLTDIEDQWHIYSDPLDPTSITDTFDLDIPIEDIVDLDGMGGMPYTEFNNTWGVVLYNHANYTDLLMPSDNSEAENYLVHEGQTILLDRQGFVVRGSKGE